MTASRELVLLLSLTSAELGPHEIKLTKKAIAGLERYAGLWHGSVRVVMDPSAGDSGNLDDVVVDRRTLPFAVNVLPLGSQAVRDSLKSAALVVGCADHRLNGSAAFCREHGVPYVFNSEYTLKTRWQIAKAERSDTLRYTRRLLWEWQQERAFLREVKLASGAQCNGTPTFDAYEQHAKSALLYFDTRSELDMLATPEQVVSKAARRRKGGPLRLLFSGRLSAMKGADDLPAVARALAKRGVDFEFDICGAGPCEADMRAAVAKDGLTSRVRFRGVLDFHRELVPMVSNEIDLFVCCHRQGDPSCTYLETMGSGVPIAGYANEAFAGLLRRVDVGWQVPIDDAGALADAVARLAHDGGADELTLKSERALAFARLHTFEATFERRIEHFRELAR
jgi:colanic acid/amylovoran biosynthesis glycosyltransferase